MGGLLKAKLDRLDKAKFRRIAFCRLINLIKIAEHKAKSMLKRQARRTVSDYPTAQRAFTKFNFLLSKMPFSALPGPGAVTCCPAVRSSRQLEPSPLSPQLGSCQTLSLQLH